MIAIINADIYDFHEYRTSQYILCKDSRIEAVGPMAAYPSDMEVSETLDAGGTLVMPGLIIGHTHPYSAFVRGLRLPFQPGTFTQLLRQLWWRMDAGTQVGGCGTKTLLYEVIATGVAALLY